VTAPTAERLMRSRYSAFAVGDVGYLLATWHARTRPPSLGLDPDVEWRRLEILGVTAGGAQDDEGTVEFIAHYWDAARRQRGQQHEDSAFVREDGQWFYVGLARGGSSP
jgi:SEC-C motif-containing protein